MNKRNAYVVALVVWTTGVTLITESHAASTYRFTSATSVDQTGSDPALTSSKGVYADNGGTYSTTNTTASTADSAHYGIHGFASGATWATVSMTHSSTSGLTISSDGSTSPQHAIDNGKAIDVTSGSQRLGNTEAVMLSFSDSVMLSSVTFGWVSGDSDFSLFRYNGVAPSPGNAPSLTSSPVEATKNGMQLAGWELVGNYDGAGSHSSSQVSYAVNADPDGAGSAKPLGSSWWLISAYNTSYSTTAKNFGTLDQGDDYFKLYSVGATKTPGTDVPEPGSLALMSLGLVGLVAGQRRRSKTASVPI